ncbi:DNA-processing protein DprA [Cohaesibacter gelatinilyticus]|nr:DNA-processing protein DprA [Cohaesibacter gelatinilyticus]
MAHRLSDQQRFNWLRLIRSENIGPATFRDLLNHFGSAEKALEAVPTLSERGGAKRKIQIASKEDTEREWEAVYKTGARLVALGEPDYPRDLTHTHAPPPILTIAGQEHWAQKTIVAIVGSRNCSASGLKLTQTLASQLGQNDIVVASGLARGIDTAAHTASLETGTIAVVAGGLGKLYPKENIPLAHQISHNGMIISEAPFSWQARAQDFPRRNRIISGISAGTLVIEAAKRSGSLITARYALEQGREVFAIPGSPLDPRSAGTNHLIKQGACLVTQVDDILEALAHYIPKPNSSKALLEEYSAIEPDHLEPDLQIVEIERDKLVCSLNLTPIAIDELARLTSMPLNQIQMILLELDLAGRLERHGNQTVSLRPQ